MSLRQQLTPARPAVAPRTTALPLAAIALAGVVLLLGTGVTPNAELAILAVAILVSGSALLWRPGEAPVLLYIFIYQWFQASIAIFYANLRGEPLANTSFVGSAIETSTTLSLLAVLALSLGMKIGAGPKRPDVAELAVAQARAVPYRTWVAVYIGSIVVALVSAQAIRVVPGLAQPLLVLIELKWAAFFILTYALMVAPGRTSASAWLMIFVIELVMSLGTYFSNFKQVFIFAGIAMIAARVTLAPWRVALLSLMVVGVLFLGLAWTAIKPTYRMFLSGGATTQTETVSQTQRLAKLLELGLALDGDELMAAADDFARRLAYVEYFGAVLNYVPRVVPHEEGALWLDAVSRPFMPRALFPDKAPILDSDRTMKYTGLKVAGAAEGTSISIGYVAESYIDFGTTGMFAAVLGLGLALGLFYRWLFAGHLTRGLIGMGLACPMLLPAAALETSGPKIVGALAVNALVIYLFARFVLPHLFRILRRRSVP